MSKKSKKSSKAKKSRKLSLTSIKNKIDDLLLEKLKQERGARCEICGKTTQLGLFHVLSKGAHHRLRYAERNLLIAGWFCCHLPWHHDYYIARDRIIPRIKELLGENYEYDLLDLERSLPKLNELEIKRIYQELGGIL